MYTKLLLLTLSLLFITQTVSISLNTTNICEDREIPCDHICNVENVTAVCSCNPGSYLHSNGYTCVECEPGTYGHSCLQSCMCNQGNGCSKVNGTCMCNSCWTGTMCDDGISSSCFRDFLTNPDKSLATYGNQVPVPPDTFQIIDVLRDFFSTEEAGTILTAEHEIIVNRPDSARELLQIIVSLDSVNFLSLSEMTTETARWNVKLGYWRCTLIVPGEDTWVVNI